MSTVNKRQLNAVASSAETTTAVPATDVQFCAIDDPTCEACQ